MKKQYINIKNYKMCRLRSFLLCVILGLSATTLFASTSNRIYDVLDKLEATILQGTSTVTIHFNVPVTYQGHTPRGEGQNVIVKLKPVAVNREDVAAFKKDENTSESYRRSELLSWKATDKMPLQEVRYEGNSTLGPQLEILFARKVKFKIVQEDVRSLSIVMESNGAGDSEGTSSVKSKFNYVINLDSAKKRFDISKINVRKFPADYKFYSIKHNGLYHLRVGVFHSAQEIKQAMAKLKSHYPKPRAILADADDMAQASPGQNNRVAEPDVKKLQLSSNLTAPQLMANAKKAMIDTHFSYAIAVYTKVMVEYPRTKYAKQALEYLGLARQRNNQLAHAKADYKKYLKLYPNDKSTPRVRQRLESLITAATNAQGKLKNKKQVREANWQTNGNVYSSIRTDKTRVDSTTPVEVETTNMVTSVNAMARRKTQKDDFRVRFSGSHSKNLNGTNSEDVFRVNYMYFDYKNLVSGYGARLGRQSKTSGGVLGRFDGLSMDYRLSSRLKLNAVTGFPVSLMNGNEIKTNKYFGGLNLDLATSNKYLSYNLYFIHQIVDEITDRSAIGGEMRYLNPRRTFFVMMDYDTSYSELNTFLFVNNWKVGKNSTFNLSFDYRRSPLLTTSNALQGQAVSGIEELLKTLSEDEVRQLARDRTAAYTSLSLSTTVNIAKDWMFSGDIVVSKLDGTPASGGVAAVEDTDNEFYYTAQLIRSNWLKEGSTTSFGIRYSDTTNYEKYTYSFDLRYPISRRLRVSPRFDVESQTLTDGTEVYILRPGLRVDYRFSDRVRVELEGRYAQSEYRQSLNDRDVTDYSISLGLIADF